MEIVRPADPPMRANTAKPTSDAPATTDRNITSRTVAVQMEACVPSATKLVFGRPWSWRISRDIALC